MAARDMNPVSENDEIIKEFLTESTENLDQLDRDLIGLEKDPTSHEILSSIFRTIHSLKGTTGFLGFTKLESVAHSGENLLGRVRDGEIKLTPEVTGGLLAMVDAVREMLAAIESTSKDGAYDYKPLIETLQHLQEPPAAQPPGEKAGTVKEAKRWEDEEDISPPLGQILIRSNQVTETQVNEALQAQRAGDPRHLGEILVERGAVPSRVIKAALEEQRQAQVLLAASNSIRVDVAQLDKLMNLVGELVHVRNQILQYGVAQRDPTMLAAFQRLNLITTNLLAGVMKTRMQPVENVWSKIPRMVRDLAVSLGKQVRVEMEGKETDLDKAIIEAIKDPLMHIVRNAVDHGIELPGYQVAAGKPSGALLLLRAYHEGGQVNIEISDDGAGINTSRVKQKAVERHLITPERAARMGEREAVNLIFLPGFSTARIVTNVSGRGVGLDVVKTNIEKIGGTVDVETRRGQGST